MIPADAAVESWKPREWTSRGSTSTRPATARARTLTPVHRTAEHHRHRAHAGHGRGPQHRRLEAGHRGEEQEQSRGWPRTGPGAGDDRSSGWRPAMTNITFCPDTTSRCERPALAKSSATAIEPPRSSPSTNPLNSARWSSGSERAPSTTSDRTPLTSRDRRGAVVDDDDPLGHQPAPHVTRGGERSVSPSRLEPAGDLDPFAGLTAAEPPAGAAPRRELEPSDGGADVGPPAAEGRVGIAHQHHDAVERAPSGAAPAPPTPRGPGPRPAAAAAAATSRVRRVPTAATTAPSPTTTGTAFGARRPGDDRPAPPRPRRHR